MYDVQRLAVLHSPFAVLGEECKTASSAKMNHHSGLNSKNWQTIGPDFFAFLVSLISIFLTVSTAFVHIAAAGNIKRKRPENTVNIHSFGISSLPSTTPSQQTAIFVQTTASATIEGLNGSHSSKAYSSKAYLSKAYLPKAYLPKAYLSKAYLSKAYLSKAYLSKALATALEILGAQGRQRVNSAESGLLKDIEPESELLKALNRNRNLSSLRHLNMNIFNIPNYLSKTIFEI